MRDDLIGRLGKQRFNTALSGESAHNHPRVPSVLVSSNAPFSPEGRRRASSRVEGVHPGSPINPRLRNSVATPSASPVPKGFNNVSGKHGRNSWLHQIVEEDLRVARDEEIEGVGKADGRDEAPDVNDDLHATSSLGAKRCYVPPESNEKLHAQGGQLRLQGKRSGTKFEEKRLDAGMMVQTCICI